MAFNPHSFETAYGFSLLDELHNFFPELLYDNELFPTENIAWMRHRIRTLFPAVYPRQHNMYSIYHSRTRIADYARWHRDYVTPDAPPPTRRYTNMGVPPTPPPPRFSVDISGAYSPLGGAGAGIVEEYPQGPPARLLSRRLARNVDPVPQLFTSVLFDLPTQTTQNSFLNLLNLAFQDVVVATSTEQINNASRLETHVGMPADTICSICQDHTQEGDENPDWRILGCGHSYHAPCIDTWLASHVHCPVCRADVRTLHAPRTTPRQS